VKLRNLTTNFLLLKLNQRLKIFYRVVFTHRLLSSLVFVSVGILMDGMIKNVMSLDTLMNFLNLSVFACKRSVIANTLMYIQIITLYIFLCHYNTILRKTNPNIPGMRGLSISVHRSCSFAPDPFEYKYIISVNITSFWGIKCTIGNIYVPTVTHREERKNAFSEITNWIKKHTNTPSILVGDFNMSKSQLESLLNKSSHQ